MNEKKINPHKDHRERLRQRFVREGMDNFPDHNKLELLLFYAIPRKDTNELAHRLLEAFGSFAGVLDADYEALCRVEGIGENAATFLKLMPQVARAYLMDKETRYPTFGDLHKMGSYLVNYFVGETNEKAVVIFLNNRVEMIDLLVLSEGIVNAAEIPVRKIAEAGLARKASFFLLAHNHPDGTCLPSEEDRALTAHISRLFRDLGMPLAEHLVIGGSSYYGILSGEKNGTFFGGLPGAKR